MLMALSLLNAIFVIVGGYVAITYLFPMLRDFLSGTLKDDKSIDGLMGIFNLYVIVFVFVGVARELLLINNQYLNYISIINPALTLITDLIPFLQYVVLAVLVVIGLNAFKKK